MGGDSARDFHGMSSLSGGAFSSLLAAEPPRHLEHVRAILTSRERHASCVLRTSACGRSRRFARPSSGLRELLAFLVGRASRAAMSDRISVRDGLSVLMPSSLALDAATLRKAKHNSMIQRERAQLRRLRATRALWAWQAGFAFSRRRCAPPSAATCGCSRADSPDPAPAALRIGGLRFAARTEPPPRRAGRRRWTTENEPLERARSTRTSLLAHA